MTDRAGGGLDYFLISLTRLEERGVGWSTSIDKGLCWLHLTFGFEK